MENKSVIETLIEFIKLNGLDQVNTQKTIEGFMVYVTIEKIEEQDEEV